LFTVEKLIKVVLVGLKNLLIYFRTSRATKTSSFVQINYGFLILWRVTLPQQLISGEELVAGLWDSS